MTNVNIEHSTSNKKDESEDLHDCEEHLSEIQKGGTQQGARAKKMDTCLRRYDNTIAGMTERRVGHRPALQKYEVCLKKLTMKA